MDAAPAERALATYKGLLQGTLGGYSTTMDEDQEALGLVASGNATSDSSSAEVVTGPRTRLALQFRLSQKQMLTQGIAGASGISDAATSSLPEPTRLGDNVGVSDALDVFHVEDVFDSPMPAELGVDAAALLEETGGDVEKAQQSYMGYTLAYLEEVMPELYEQIKANAGAVPKGQAHAALVELTWDAIA
eukprot:7388313-Prymnesium_polylepis.1